jgi:hypothetical protein
MNIYLVSIINSYCYFRQVDLHHVTLSGKITKTKLMKLEGTLAKVWNASLHQTNSAVKKVNVTVVAVMETVDMATRSGI